MAAAHREACRKYIDYVLSEPVSAPVPVDMVATPPAPPPWQKAGNTPGNWEWWDHNAPYGLSDYMFNTMTPLDRRAIVTALIDKVGRETPATALTDIVHHMTQDELLVLFLVMRTEDAPATMPMNIVDRLEVTEELVGWLMSHPV